MYTVDYTKAAKKTLAKWKNDETISVLVIQAEEHYEDK